MRLDTDGVANEPDRRRRGRGGAASKKRSTIHFAPTRVKLPTPAETLPLRRTYEESWTFDIFSHSSSSAAASRSSVQFSTAPGCSAGTKAERTALLVS